MLLRLYFDYRVSLEITGFLKSENPGELAVSHQQSAFSFLFPVMTAVF